MIIKKLGDIYHIEDYNYGRLKKLPQDGGKYLIIQ